MREPRHLLPQRRPALRVKPGRGLVKKEDPRPVDKRQGKVQPPFHATRVATHSAIGRLVSQPVPAAFSSGLDARPCRSPGASPAAAGARGRSGSGPARLPAARPRSSSAPASPDARCQTHRHSPVRSSAAAASSASGRSSTCRPRWARGSRRSHPAKRPGRWRRPLGAPCRILAPAARPRPQRRSHSRAAHYPAAQHRTKAR